MTTMVEDKKYYYNLTDRGIVDIRQLTTLDLSKEAAQWPQNAVVLQSGMGFSERVVQSIAQARQDLRFIGIDATLSLDDTYQVRRDSADTYHIYPADNSFFSIDENDEILPYHEFVKKRRCILPQMPIITKRIPPIDLPDKRVDIILDIFGPSAYSYQDPATGIDALMKEYSRVISKTGVVYVTTSDYIHPETFYKAHFGRNAQVTYFTGNAEQIARVTLYG